MTSIQIFDPVSSCGCASGGGCGGASQAQTEFAADLAWATGKGANIERIDLGRQAAAFVDNAAVQTFLQRSGKESLPLILVGGEMVLAGRYPSRAELARWAGIAEERRAHPEGTCCGSCGGQG